jgi:hypothetical protein
MTEYGNWKIQTKDFNYKKLHTTMAISNCWFSPTSENPRGFSVWCVLAKLSANPRNYS